MSRVRVHLVRLIRRSSTTEGEKADDMADAADRKEIERLNAEYAACETL